MNYLDRYRALFCGVATFLITTNGNVLPAHAQDTGTTVANEETVLEPIVVTSRKQDEQETRLPVATTILTPEQVAPSTLDPLSEISRQAPGTVFTDFSRFGESYLTMRGIATLGGAQNPLDSTVGFSTDGIPTSLSGLNAPLLDVDRIEILRGPQGTTFGRNALAGSINVVTKPADGSHELRLDTEVGTDGYGFVQGTAGGWIVPDAVAGRGVIRFENFDGDIPNSVIGGADGGSKIGAAHGTIRVTPDDTLTIDMTGDYSRNRNSNPSNILLEAEDYPTSGQDIHPLNRQNIASGSLRIDKEFDTVRFTSVTGYQDIRVDSANDYTDSLLFGSYFASLYGAALYPYYAGYFADPTQDKMYFRDRERIFNQEFRVSSLDDSPVQWVVGANYFHSAYSLHRDMQTSLWPTLNGTIDNDITSQTIAVFGDASVPLGELWELSGGLRLAHDDQELDGNYVSNGYSGTVPFFTQGGTYSDTYLTGRLALSRKWTEDIMSYVSVARGYSSGGFEKSTQYAAYGIATEPFDPATAWTYEVGTKAQVNEWLRLNGALFYNDVSDGQLATFDTTTLTSAFTNQDYRSYGFEASAVASVTDTLDLFGGFAVIRSELVDVTTKSAAAGAVEGRTVPQIPSFAANLGLNYRFDAERLGIPGAFTASANYQFVGTRYSDVSNNGKLDPYHIVNAKLAWQKDNLTVYAFANNLLDERPVYYAVPIASGVSASYVGRGRVLGLGMSVQW